MAKFNDDDMYVLNSLKGAGMTGRPLFSLVMDAPAEPEEILTALQRLERKGIIAIDGPKNLSNLAQLIIKAAQPKTAENGVSQCFNGDIFLKGDPEERTDYFFTHVRLTLRGRAVAYFAKPATPDGNPSQDPPKPEAP